MESAVIWPKKFLPGTTDNYVSNEVVVKDLKAEQVWKYIVDNQQWAKYNDALSEVETPASGSSVLKKGDKFHFTIFGFPHLDVEVLESIPPTATSPGRLGWTAVYGTGDQYLDVYHAWIIENLDYGAVRVLTQESQIGKPAAALAAQKPNPMLNGHQSWLEALIKFTKEQESK